MRRSLACLIAAALPLGGALACPCVETEVIDVDRGNRRLIVAVSETSRVMVTAALWELLLTEIQPHHADWRGQWRVSFYTTPEAAAQDGTGPAVTHVADYDRAHGTLTLWPRLEPRREVIDLVIK